MSEHGRFPPLPDAAALAEAYALCVGLLREADPDRHYANLFVPTAARPHLAALYAFNAEIARIRDQVSEPMPGEIRLQWWRDVLSAPPGADPGAPVARALRDTVERFHLPVPTLLALIEARGFDLYDDPMPTFSDLAGYCAETASALIRLASFVLAGGTDPGAAHAAGKAGLALAYTGLLRLFPLHASRGQCFLPHETLIACGVTLESVYAGEDSEGLRAALAEWRRRARCALADLRTAINEVPPAIAPAFYPICLVEPYLDRMDRADYHPFRTRVDLAPLTKLWRIGRGAWRARAAA